jgi:hypothetical protein
MKIELIYNEDKGDYTLMSTIDDNGNTKSKQLYRLPENEMYNLLINPEQLYK